MMLMWRYFMSGQLAGATGGKTVRRIFIAVCSPLLLTGEKPLKTPEDLANIRYYMMRRAVTGRHIPDSWVKSYQRSARANF